MNARCKSRIFKTLFWVATEILLNVTGFDNLADYSEFISENHPEIEIHLVMMTRSLPQDSRSSLFLIC